MAGLDFKTAIPREEEDAAVVKHNTRVGLVLFFVYVVVYAGFMGMSSFAPQRMSTPFLFGLNLSVVYGFALIALALILALVYMKLCRKTRQ